LTVLKKPLKITDLEMEEEAGIKEVIDGHEEKVLKEEIFTKVVRAGKRTYFFDVKATRKDDYYLTITESKKRLGKEGKVFYEKHKIFLYKEDFEKFADGLKDAVAYIVNERNDTADYVQTADSDSEPEKTSLAAVEFTSIEFDDLGEK
jgi:hypothetical protein